MKIVPVLALLALGGSTCATLAQTDPLPTATYIPYSRTAMGVTGTVRTAPGRLVLAGHSFPLKLEKVLSGPDLKNAATVLSLQSVVPDSSAALYRVHIPAERKLKNGNTFCGSDPTTYVLLMFNGKDLGLAGFSGQAVPDLTPAVIGNSTSLCGTYGYTRR